MISLTLQCNCLVFYYTQKTAKITKYGITSQHIAEMSLCCEVIPSFVTFADDQLVKLIFAFFRPRSSQTKFTVGKRVGRLMFMVSKEQQRITCHRQCPDWPFLFLCLVPLNFSPPAKFDVCSFSLSSDNRGPKIQKLVT